MHNTSHDGEEEGEEFYENEAMGDHEEGNYSKRVERGTKQKAGTRRAQEYQPTAAEYGIPEDATPESMAEINDKLAGELEQLIMAVENQIDRVKKEKEEELKMLKIREEPDADVRRKENELKRAQVKIQSLKKGISQMKKQIDNAYDVEKTLVLENELKDHQNNFEKLLLQNRYYTRW